MGLEKTGSDLEIDYWGADSVERIGYISDLRMTIDDLEMRFGLTAENINLRLKASAGQAGTTEKVARQGAKTQRSNR